MSTGAFGIGMKTDVDDRVLAKVAGAAAPVRTTSAAAVKEAVDLMR